MFQLKKLNRLTPITIKGAAPSPLFPFFDLETLIESVVRNGKNYSLVLDQISDAVILDTSLELECTGVNGIIVQKAGSAPVNGYQ
jgi:23S rRNA (guanosine2251-2'-O)-methyltransferase